MVRLDKLTFAYPASLPIFKDFSWKIGRGETWSILGPSGCGKSTLLYLLAGLRFPSGGEIRISGQPLTRPRPQTGLIIQEYGLLPWATVRQNAQLGLRIREFYGPDGTHAPVDRENKVDVEYWLERLQLLPHAEKYPTQLSGG
jgi:ABC-type nitrate/sulfonate/bicarbonate transport system ATPase subunit